MTASDLSDKRRGEIVASFARQGFLAGLDGRIALLEQGRCVIAMPFSAAVSQQHGYFHGGAIGALADTAGGYAAMTLAPDGSDVVTLEYKINFLRPAEGDLLEAEATVLRAGRSITVTRVDVYVRTGSGRVHCAAVQQSIALARSSDARS